MNNTQSLQIIKLLNHLSAVDQSAYESIGSNLDDLVKERRERSYCQGAADVARDSTQSEWEFINALKGIADFLREPDGDVSAWMSVLSDRVAAQMPALKVAFFIQECYLPMSFRTIYAYFCSLENCTVDFVFVHSEKVSVGKGAAACVNWFQGGDCRAFDMVNYDLSTESPDVVFYFDYSEKSDKTSPEFCIEEVSKRIRYTVFIPSHFDVLESRDLARQLYAHPMFYYAWKVFAYSSRYASKLKRYSYRDASNIVDMGHPMFDGVKSAMKQGAFRLSEWDARIDNRPVVLWSTHFRSEDSGEKVDTFFKYKDTVLSYFCKNKDKVLLWRPHPRFWGYSGKVSRFDEKDIDLFLEKVNEMNNVIIDTEFDHRYSLATADAVLSDATTLLIEFAATGKPAMCLLEENGVSVINEAYSREIELCSDKSSLDEFLDRAGMRDGREEQRRLYYEKELGMLDEQNGKRIGEYIYDAIAKDREQFVYDCLSKVM